MPKTSQKTTPKTLYVLQEINSKNLKVLGEDYQRELNEGRVAKIVASFNELVANEPKVSFRDGRYYIFDGQHTVAARIVLNGNKHLPILCKVYEGLTAKDEAFLFATQNGEEAKPTSGERMRAWIYGGDIDAIAFKNATESTGITLELGKAHCKYHLVCVNAAHELYRKVGEKLYIDALNIIVEAWDGDVDSMKIEVLNAICRFIRLYHNVYDRERLIWKLKAVSPKLLRQAINSDFELPGYKKHLNQIYKIYNGGGKAVIEKRF